MSAATKRADSGMATYWVHWCRSDREWLWTARRERCNWCGVSCEEVAAAAQIAPPAAARASSTISCTAA